MTNDSDSLQFDLPNFLVDLESIESILLKYMAQGDLSDETSHRLSEWVKEREECLELLPTCVLERMNSANAPILSGFGRPQLKKIHSLDDKVF